MSSKASKASKESVALQGAHHRGQLGFDFSTFEHAQRAQQALSRSGAQSYPNPSELTDLESVSEPHAMAPHWQSPKMPPTWIQGPHALSMACATQNGELARALLALPIEWDLNASFNPIDPDADGHPTALGHLLRHKHSHHYQQPHAPGMDAISHCALLLIERGARFTAEDHTGFSPITQCAVGRRQEIFTHLRGHPDYTFAAIGSARVGPLSARQEGASGHKSLDHRVPLLGFLLHSEQLIAAKSLVEDAGFPLNDMDLNGRYPIGYCRSLEAVDMLIHLGAHPELVDSNGLNALARAQEVDVTSTRDKMITRIATALKKDAHSDPNLLGTLQAQNVAALLDVAKKAPKSSLIKTINAFGFDVATVCDPKTLITPLMATFDGGRLASAAHLIHVGSNLNAVDAKGVSAAARMLGGHETPNGPKSVELCKSFADRIDFSLLSKRGWPVALEAAWLMPTYRYSNNWRSKKSCGLDVALASRSKDMTLSWISAKDGTSLMEAYASSCSGGSSHTHVPCILHLHEISSVHSLPGAHDRGLAAILRLLSHDQHNFESRFDVTARQSVEHFQTLILSAGYSCPKTSAFLSGNSAMSCAIGKHFPALFAHIEASELEAINQGSAVSRKHARL